jgi:hypothetical protein
MGTGKESKSCSPKPTSTSTPKKPAAQNKPLQRYTLAAAPKKPEVLCPIICTE